MNTKSNYGVYYNTHDRDIYFVYDHYKIYFSSEFYKNKFANELENFQRREYTKIFHKYGIVIDLYLYLVFSLYEKIEKRGYKIEDLESKQLILDGNFMDLEFMSKLRK